MTLDTKLRWKEHIKKKHDELNIKFRKIYWLLGPVWSYGIQLWGCASDSNIQVIQRIQNKVLKCILEAPWYIRNSDLHRDLRIETVTDIITRLASSHKKRLQNHFNSQVSRLLKRKQPFELVKQ
jgi:hypothetical protein